MKIPYTDYIRSSCELVNDKIFLGLWKVTNEYPCAGCALEHQCVVRKQLEFKNSPKSVSKMPLETNAQIAARLHVTKRQVAKMRKRGEL